MRRLASPLNFPVADAYVELPWWVQHLVAAPVALVLTLAPLLVVAGAELSLYAAVFVTVATLPGAALHRLVRDRPGNQLIGPNAMIRVLARYGLSFVLTIQPLTLAWAWWWCRTPGISDYLYAGPDREPPVPPPPDLATWLLVDGDGTLVLTVFASPSLVILAIAAWLATFVRRQQQARQARRG